MKFQKKIIFELKKREQQLQNALKESEQETEYQKAILQRCQEKPKTDVSELLFQKDQLQKHKQHAEQRIHILKKEVQRYKKWNNEYKQKIEYINRRRKELQFRNGSYQEQENCNILIEENESLRAEIYDIQARMADEKKEKMGVIGDLKLDINNLKLQRFRASENVRKIQAELDKNALQFQKERTQLKTEITTLQLQYATQSTEPIR
ncbi:uncharacterized protein LOC143043781 [Mytilus galloprovincialis]|uniref:uncharacterized protein LOC143043781 n=1 Tax=Mytilus galloprovincialis TaxID=29158 RepID=UPI003F7BCA29